ncbi:MAG: hypothetical protein P0Y50_10490 [Candidatus Brevundimonas colombiensis]|uniref:Uncharacterized protein n=1 Tax=Candidatus Brevundimonas colombiensis TaxID=3121376 RepID=A0AAJ6BKG6_9CAUL|nr:hypothetical protein [Brevundimonas sp.]WEK38974.1 MAG: hypothetical protein P0Y50_10490 [Brevundimonas sp.]
MKRAALETAPPFLLRLVLGRLTAVGSSLFVVVQAKTMMIDLGAAMHDAYCHDH